MVKLFIPILAATTRQERKSIFAAKLVEQVGREIGEIEVELIDPLNFSFPFDGNDSENKDPHYTAITVRADAFFIVTPEYNHSFPGTLKRMLDSELENYLHKPVAFGGVSSGQWGGVRAIEALVTSVREMGLISTFTDVQFPNIEKIFNEKGELQEEAFKRRIKRTYAELVWMAKTLKWGRQNLATNS